MGFFLRVILIALLGYLIIRSIRGLLGFGTKSSTNFEKNKTEIEKDENEDRSYKGGEYIDYEEVD